MPIDMKIPCENCPSYHLCEMSGETLECAAMRTWCNTGRWKIENRERLIRAAKTIASSCTTSEAV
jgi:hypothetical protein